MNNQASKQLLLDGEYKTSRLRKARFWLNELNLIPCSWDFWYDRQDWLHPTRIVRKVKNVIRWIPVVWDDVDWDYSGIHKILHFKIKSMKDHHIDHHNHTDWEEIVAQMGVAEHALERLYKNDYAAKFWDDHMKKFPKDKEKWIELPNGHRQMPPISTEEHDSLKALIEEEERAWQFDTALFTSALTTHIRGWWD